MTHPDDAPVPRLELDLGASDPDPNFSEARLFLVTCHALSRTMKHTLRCGTIGRSDPPRERWRKEARAMADHLSLPLYERQADGGLMHTNPSPHDPPAPEPPPAVAPLDVWWRTVRCPCGALPVALIRGEDEPDKAIIPVCEACLGALRDRCTEKLVYRSPRDLYATFVRLPALPPVTARVQCHADRDGDCRWAECPQLAAGEPYASGRSCPILPHPDDDR